MLANWCHNIGPADISGSDSQFIIDIQTKIVLGEQFSLAWYTYQGGVTNGVWPGISTMLLHLDRHLML
jgi:hypothetical protein